MYEILVLEMLDGLNGNRIYLGHDLELPATDEIINKMMAGLNITEKERPFTAYDYRFRLDALNNKITGERRLDELNRFAKYLSTLQEYERDQLVRFANRRTRLSPTECMTDPPLFIGEDMREFTVAIMPLEYHSVPSVGYLHLPATQEEFIDAFDRARAFDTKYYIDLRECRCRFFWDALPEAPELFELNHLAERIASLDYNEILFFEAMVKMEKNPPDMARLINLTYNLDNCVITRASSLWELGRFAIDNNFFPELEAFPKEDYRYLNFKALGQRFQDEQGGVFVGGCFIANLAREDEIKTPYSGNPPVPNLKQSHILRLFLECSPENGRAVWLNLPANNYDMEQTAKQLGWENLADRGFICCRSSIPKLDKALTGNKNIYELNDFAEHLASLRDQGELPKYKAALEITNCADLSDLITLAENLNNYEFYPEIVSEYDYGEWELLGQYKLDHTSPGMEHFDFAVFGRERMKQNGVVSTPYGMIRMAGPEQKLGQQDSSNAGMQFY